VLPVDPRREQALLGRDGPLQEADLAQNAAQHVHPPPVFSLASFRVLLGRADPCLQLADLGMVGPMLGDKRALAAGKLVEFVLPRLQLVLELRERAAANLPRRAAAPPPAPMPVLAAQPSHPHPQ